MDYAFSFWRIPCRALRYIFLPCPGDTAAVVGCGYMGLGTISLFKTMVDGNIIANDKRLEALENAFIESLVQNKETLISGRDMLAAVRAIFAEDKSSRMGCAVECK